MTDKSTPDPFGSIPIADKEEEKGLAPLSPEIEVDRERGSGQERVSPSPAPTGPKEERTKRPRARRKPVSGPLVWLAFLPLAAFVFYLLAGYLFVPHLLRSVLPAHLTRTMERPVTIGAADFNPFTLTITLQNGIVGSSSSDPGDKVDPLLSFARLELDLAAASLIRFGLICKKVEMERFFLHLVRNQDSSYNIQNLLQSSSGNDRLPLAGGLRFSFNNISINDSRLLFDDRPTGKTHSLEEINLALPMVANLAFRPDQYLHPRFSAKINGSPVELTGETRVEGGELKARLKLQLARIDLAEYFGYLPMAANFRPGKGRADLDLELVFQTGAPADTRLQIEGTGRLTDVWLQSTAENKEIARLPAAMGSLSFSPLSGRYRLSDLTLQQPEFLLERQPDGQWLFPRLSMDGGSLEIDRLLVTGGRVSFIDHRVRGGFADTWSDLLLSVEDFSSGGKGVAAFALSGRNLEQARVNAQGRFFPDRGRAEGIIIGHQLRLTAFNPYLVENQMVRLREGKVIHFETAFTAGSGKNAQLEFSATELAARIENLSLARQDEGLLHLEQLALNDASLHWPDRRLELGEVQADGGALLLDWDRQGHLNWLQARRAPAAESKDGWQVTMKAAGLKKTGILLRIRTLSEPLILDLRETDLTLADFGNQPGKEGGVTGSFLLFGESPVEIAGTLQLDPLAARLESRIAELPLQRLQPLFSDWFRPGIESGILHAHGEFRLPGPVFQGALQIDRFAASRDQEEIFRWRRAESDNLTIRFDSGTLQAESVFLQQPYAVWALSGDSGARPADIFDLSWSSGETPRLRLGRLRLAGGELTLIDPAASPPFTTAISGITGAIESLTSTAQGSSRLALAGHDSKDAGFALRGSFNPFGPLTAAELTAEVRGFRLSGLSPYLSEQLGYRLTGGAIDLNASYNLDRQQLRTANRLRVTGLMLGEPLSRAGNLPLTLALLTDPDGHLDLNLAVNGNITAADFSYREELRKAVRHLLLKSAVSPFSVLTESTFQSDLQEYFSFAAGRADLSPESQGQLQQLATALLKRPHLNLVLRGFADEAQDRAAISDRREAEARVRRLAREAQVSDKLAAAYGREEIAALPQRSAVVPENGKIVIPDDLLKKLAAERSETIHQYLTATLGVPAARITIAPAGKPVPAGTPGRPGNRVDVELTATRGS